MPAPAPAARQRRLLVAVLALTGTFCVTELALGFVAKSEVLKADALHLFTDAMALVLSLTAMWLAERDPTAAFPFGWSRAEPLAAVTNAVFLLGGTVAIVRSSISALLGRAVDGDHHGPAVGLMAAVGAGALVVNSVSAYLLHRGIGHHHHDHAGHVHDAHGHGQHDEHEHEHHDHAHHEHGHHRHEPHGGGAACEHAHADDATVLDTSNNPNKRHDHSLNLRGAWLHVMGDLLGGIVALATAAAVHLGAPHSVDPIAGLAIAAFLLVGAVRLLRDAGRVLLLGAPAAVPVARVRELVGAVDGVDAIDAVHSWSLGAGRYAVALRLRGAVAPADVEGALRRRFDVAHVWVHVEASP
ncbi:MAG: cation transporter [Polyangiaceae bacterium]|nr:cation transporter [Polyangiaceae bacterium]